MTDDGIRKALGRALEQFLGPAAGETGQLIADQVRYLRWRVALTIVQRAEKIAREKNLSKRSVPIKFLVPAWLADVGLRADQSLLSDLNAVAALI